MSPQAAKPLQLPGFSMLSADNLLEGANTSAAKSCSEELSRREIAIDGSKAFILYLIRHGEASHNVLEKAAQKKAKEEAMLEGFASDSEEVQHRMEEARKAVLNDVNLFDAALSDVGREEAKEASLRLDELIQNHNLPPPEEVLVSPLTRTLETADLIFPEHAGIHVREELRERQTGMPPDTRQPSSALMRRKTFRRFSMRRLRLLSLERVKLPDITDLLVDKNKENVVDDHDDDDDDEDDEDGDGSADSNVQTEEDKRKLRIRTSKLFHLLAESQVRSIAVVTHKGYLRELEHGPFQRPHSTEFKNCEIRVYRVRVGADDSLVLAERLV